MADDGLTASLPRLEEAFRRAKPVQPFVQPTRPEMAVQDSSRRRGFHLVERGGGRLQRGLRMVGTWAAHRPLHRQHPRSCSPAVGGFLPNRAEALTHPRHELDELLGHPVRFSIVALLAAASQADFKFVGDQVEVSDPVLSKQVSALEQAGYVKVEKGFIGKRGRTWLSLTGAGRRTFERHLSALRTIAEGPPSS